MNIISLLSYSALIAGYILLSAAGNSCHAFGTRPLSSSLTSITLYKHARFMNTDNNMNVVDNKPQLDTKLVPMLDRRSFLSAFTYTVSANHQL